MKKRAYRTFSKEKMQNRTARYWIEKLKLSAHPEGGWFKETYRSNELIAKQALPKRFPESRNFSTAIYYLLEEGDFSAFHSIKSDEMWHFYDGMPLEIIEIDSTGILTKHMLGLENLPQITIPANRWFAARPTGSFTLVGCTVSPGFDFADFEMANKNELMKAFPLHKEIIATMCR